MIVSNNSDRIAKIRKTKLIFSLVVFAIIFCNIAFTFVGSTLDQMQYSSTTHYPELISLSAEGATLPEGYVANEEGTKVIKVSMVLHNETNSTMSVSDGRFGYYYTDGTGYVQSLGIDEYGMILDSYDNAEILPPDETIIHTEYISVPQELSHIVFDRYMDDDASEEYVIQF